MKVRLFLALLVSMAFLGCQNRSAWSYYDCYFHFGCTSCPQTVYVYVSNGCHSCNVGFVNGLKEKKIEGNEYLLIISHYPYSESERETTMLMSDLFKDHFAIDSVDMHLRYEDVPKHTKVVKFP